MSGMALILLVSQLYLLVCSVWSTDDEDASSPYAKGELAVPRSAQGELRYLCQ